MLADNSLRAKIIGAIQIKYRSTLVASWAMYQEFVPEIPYGSSIVLKSLCHRLIKASVSGLPALRIEAIPSLRQCHWRFLVVRPRLFRNRSGDEASLILQSNFRRHRQHSRRL